MTGVKFGLINFWGLVGSIGVFVFVYYRAKREMIQEGIEIRKNLDDDSFMTLPENAPSFAKAFCPFLVLCVTFFMGAPIFLVGVGCSILVIIMTKMQLPEGEKAMVSGVTQIAIPIVAIISLMYMSNVIAKIGLVKLVAAYVGPYIALAPIQILLIISALAGTITQSNAASAPIVLPFVQIVLGLGADPLATSFAAITGCAIMQLFLSGGALTALPVVAGVIPGTNQKLANKWHRPAMLFALGISFLLTFIV